MSTGDAQEVSTLAQSQTLDIPARQIAKMKAQRSTSDLQSPKYRYKQEIDPESAVLSAIIEEIAQEQSEQDAADFIATPTQGITSEQPAGIEITIDSRATLHTQARKALAYLTRGQMLTKNAPRQDMLGSTGAQYSAVLAEWRNLQGQLSSLHSSHSAQMAALQEKVAEQEKQATEVHSQYRGALGRLLREAIDPKTGKGIPAATVTALEQSLDMKEHAADTARLRVIQLRTKLHRMHKTEHEDGTKPSLHLVDFEHLKMENAMLLDKIEARGKQLLQAQQQAQAAVHVLAHVKQKLYFEEKRRAELQAELAVAQQQLQGRKERLRLSKRRREMRKLRNIKLQEAQLLEDPTLLAHFQDLLRLREQWTLKVDLLKEDHNAALQKYHAGEPS